MKKYLFSKFNWLWISSLILFIIGMLFSFFSEDKISIEDNPILSQISNLPGWIFFILAVVIAPILEELSFRFWAVKKTWPKIFSLVASSILLFIINPYFGVIYFVLYLSIMLLFRKKRKTILTMLAILTSLGFMLAHSGNLETNIFIKVISIYTSIGLLFSYIVLRTKFIYVIYAHSIYNFILLIIGGLIIPFGNDIQLNNGNYQGLLKPVTGLYSSSKTNQYGGNTVNIHRKMLPELISMLNFESPYEFKTYPKSFNFYDLKVSTIQKDSKIDLKAVSKEIISKTKIKLDTVFEERIIYHLEIKDIDKLKTMQENESNINEGQNLINLDVFINNIFYSKNMNFNIPEQYKKIKIKNLSDKEFNYIIHKESKDQIIYYLFKEYNIILKPKIGKIKIIRVIEE